MTPATDISHLQQEDRRGHKGPERRCVASGDVLHKSQLIKFVKDPGDNVVPDINEKLPGRGVWCRPERPLLLKAIKTGAFNRGFKSHIQVEAALADLTETLLRRRVSSLMTMALKASQAYIGFDQVYSAAKGEVLAWRIEASDGAEGGRGKIRALTKAVSRELEQPWPAVMGCFSMHELGLAFGRDNLVHAALKKGPMAKNFDLAAYRLSGFCELIPADWADRGHEEG